MDSKNKKVYTSEELEIKCREAFKAGTRRQLAWTNAPTITDNRLQTTKDISEPDENTWISMNLNKENEEGGNIEFAERC